MIPLGRRCAIVVAVLGVLVLACQRAPSPTAGEAPPASQRPQTASPPARELSLYAVGDIMLDRKVGERIREVGCAALIEDLAPELARADITFGNLESALASTGSHAPSDCIFRADPKTVKVLTLGSFDVVSFANNHCLDPGREAYLQTLKHLKAAGITYVGAALERGHASWPRVLTVRGLRVGFQAFTDLDFAHGSDAKVPSDLARHQELLRQAKNKCDLLIVSYHWGTEYASKPTSRQKAVAHAAVEAGADAILGHHPHVMEGVEFYRGKPVLYSMGNFIFDQRDAPDGRMESAIFKLCYREGHGWWVKVVPLRIPPGQYGPVHAGPERRAAILRRMAGYCTALGAATRTESGVLLVTGSLPPTPDKLKKT